jgi:uncharacterized protein (TIGR00375 family)
MKQILDLHIHSCYSRACSRDLILANIDKACRLKGVDIIATGDFTYPDWFIDIKNELEEIKDSGLYKLKAAKDSRIKFILSTELALIYKDKDRVRRIHIILHAPSIKAVAELNKYLDKHYNIRSDGRPILGMSSSELVKLCLAVDPEFLIYPAHIWTPWFSVFGSKSGFNSMEACFHEQTENIYAYETGLSSDPEMNWRLSALDKLTLLSNSDAHSLQNIAREANVFELSSAPTYGEIYKAIKNKDLTKLKYTIEFYPEEGMYHYDGHRLCGVSFTPAETKKHKGICPVCKKPLVIGVCNRVEELADREAGFISPGLPGYKKLVELDKIIAEVYGLKSRNSKKVKAEYSRLIKNLDNEMNVLLNAPLKDIAVLAGKGIAEGIKRVREGNLYIKPGFDGQYGEIKIFSEDEKEENRQQKLL